MTTHSAPFTSTFPPSPQGQTWRPHAGNGYLESLKALGIALLMALPMFGLGGFLVFSDWAAHEESRLAEIERRQAHTRLIASAPLEMLPVANTAHGRDLFGMTCAACHNANGTGMEGLGKDLTISWFVASVDDAALHQFIINGRPDAKPVAMPPKGGNVDLTDSDVKDITTYIRGLQDARRMPVLPAPMLVLSAITADEKAAALAAAGGDAELAEYIAQGAKIFSATCSACHGKDGRGIERNGKNLVGSEFVLKTKDDDLLAFIRKGRDPGDPANTTGIAMPPKGGNPALVDDDILDVIAYLRSVQGTAAKK